MRHSTNPRVAPPRLHDNTTAQQHPRHEGRLDSEHTTDTAVNRVGPFGLLTDIGAVSCWLLECSQRDSVTAPTHPTKFKHSNCFRRSVAFALHFIRVPTPTGRSAPVIVAYVLLCFWLWAIKYHDAAAGTPAAWMRERGEVNDARDGMG